MRMMPIFCLAHFQPIASSAFATYTNIILLQLCPGNSIDAPDVVGVDLAIEYEIFGNFGRFKL